MPTYTYRCRTCESRFDFVQSMADPALTACPAVGGPAQCTAPGRGDVAKVFGAVGITFKGSGFYKTDSRASSSAAGRRSPNGKEKEKQPSGSRSESSPAGATSDASSSNAPSGASSGSGSSTSSGSSGSAGSSSSGD